MKQFTHREKENNLETDIKKLKKRKGRWIICH